MSNIDQNKRSLTTQTSLLLSHVMFLSYFLIVKVNLKQKIDHKCPNSDACVLSTVFAMLHYLFMLNKLFVYINYLKIIICDEDGQLHLPSQVPLLCSPLWKKHTPADPEIA